jgi:hypothetical protein
MSNKIKKTQKGSQGFEWTLKATDDVDDDDMIR